MQEAVRSDILNGFLACQIIAAPVFQAKMKNLSNQEYVEVLYRTMFDREGDPSGMGDWLVKLENGMRQANRKVRPLPPPCLRRSGTFSL